MARLSFYSDGLRIAAQLHEPDAASAAPRPAIVMVQGMVGRKELFGFPRIAERFNALGYVALTFDYRGVGESEGEPGRLYPLELVEDVRSAVDFLAQQPGVDPGRIALWGTSFGGAAVPHAAALDRRVCAAISIAGFGDGERWLMAGRTTQQRAALERRIDADRRQRVLTGKSQLVEPSELFAADPQTAAARARVVAGPPGMDVRTAAVTLESVERILEFRPGGVVERIAPRPALFIAAERDVVTPVEGIADMHRHAREPRRLEVLPGITHYEIYEEPHIGRIVGWTHGLLGALAAGGA
jgi:pimeloyl-ACP methyl ester carboxylesterase